jgi:hypothetical protein
MSAELATGAITGGARQLPIRVYSSARIAHLLRWACGTR